MRLAKMLNKVHNSSLILRFIECVLDQATVTIVSGSISLEHVFVALSDEVSLTQKVSVSGRDLKIGRC